MQSTLINLSLFKAGWAACVFGAAAGMPVVGAAVCGLAALVHLARTDNPGGELKLLIAAALVGLGWESFLVAGGLLTYAGESPEALLAPGWIVAMWMLFATTMNVSMRWLRRSPWLAAAFGGIGGPLSFWFGERAGAASFTDPVLALTAIGIGWAMLLPLLVALARHFETRSFQTAEEMA